MRYRREEWSIKSGLAKGRKPPEWYLEKPDLCGVEGFYLAAFWDCSTMRHFGTILGWIPWDRAREYACEKGLPDDMLDPFWDIVHTIDSGYLEWMRSEHDKASKQKQAGGLTPPVPGVRGRGGTA